MSHITVEIIVKGLIAMAPLFTAGEADHMTALVIDSQQAPTESVCMADHIPEIEFPTSPQECTASRTNGCRWEPNVCICSLNGHKITLLPDATPTQKIKPQERPRVLPFTKAEDSAGDFNYVANITHMGYSLNPAFLGASPPSILTARFHFPFDSLLACDHSSRRDDLSDNVHPLEFRQLGELPEAGDLCQAAAQILVADVSLDISNQPPTLRLTKFDGSAEYDFVLEPGAETTRIELRNHRPMPGLPIDDPCDDGIGRDFAFFYELVNNPPPWNDRELPHVKHTLWKSYVDISPERCEKYKTPTSRPICPLATVY